MADKGALMVYRALTPQDIHAQLLDGFVRRQEVTRCMRKIAGEWKAVDIAFVDDWDDADRAQRICRFGRMLSGGGYIAGAFIDGHLKGFAAVPSGRFGAQGQYMELKQLHVSREMRARGIGRALFAMAADFARAQGAQKLYISAHSAVQTQAFYRAMGCVEAQEVSQRHVDDEPCDCQMEFVL